jgi:hypothetical protein
MSKAHVDPAEIRRFAAELSRFNNDLSAMGRCAKMRNLESRATRSSAKFSEGFDQTVKALSVFLENSHQHVGFLGKKASLIETT